MNKKQHHYLLGAFVVLFTITCLVFLSGSLTDNETLRQLAHDLGYLGAIFAGVIGGLNIIVPIPAATLTPLFVAAGLSLPIVILMITIGTIIADYVGYVLGYISREMIKHKWPRLFSFFYTINKDHHRLIVPAVFAFAAIMPIPNEIFLIPLALSGVRFRILILPLFFGSLINQTALSYGFTGIFDVLF